MEKEKKKIIILPLERNCGNCQFFVEFIKIPNVVNQYHGECRRWPEYFLKNREDWCGEHGKMA